MTSSLLTLRAGVAALAYRTPTRFALLSDFLTHLELPLNEPVATFDDVVGRLDDASDRLVRSGTPADRVVSRDIEVLRRATPIEEAFSGAHGLSWSESLAAPEQSLALTSKAIETTLLGAGLEMPRSTCPHVVDRLPAIRGTAETSAIVIDAEDHRVYGYDPGVYFLRTETRPIYTDFLYCHEVIHALLGEKHPELVAHGLEEGLAEFAGALWLSGSVLGPEQTQRLFILNRLSRTYPLYWERYLDTTRYWLAEYLEHGFGVIVAALRDGRSRLLERERHGWTRGFPTARDDAREPDWFRSLAVSLLLRFPRANIVTPAALLFAESTSDGLTVVEIGVRAGLSRDQAVAAAAELRDELGLLYLRRDGIVVLDGKAAQAVADDWLRYSTGGSDEST